MKKRLFTLISMLLALSVLSGCSVNKPRQVVTLNVWHNYFGGGSMQYRMDSLIDAFNRDAGRQLGININVSLIGTSSDLVKNFQDVFDESPGTPELPDIAIVYPRTAKALHERNLLLELDSYFNEEELVDFKAEFLEEGKVDGKLLVLPINKSSEVIFLNQSYFDETFLAISSVDVGMLAETEALFSVADRYYHLSKSLNEDKDGKAFLAIDSWYNFFQIYMSQKGAKLLDERGNINYQDPHFQDLWNLMADSALLGSLSSYTGYASELSRTGDVICSIGSTAGINYYGDEVTTTDGHTEKIAYQIYPFPVAKEGKAIAIQRGGGLVVLRSNKEKEEAAITFIKWLTEAQRNYQFTLNSGYMPVKNNAYDNFMQAQDSSDQSPVMQNLHQRLAEMSSNYTLEYTPLSEQAHALNEDFDIVIKDLLNSAKAEAKSLTDDELAYQALKDRLLEELKAEMEK